MDALRWVVFLTAVYIVAAIVLIARFDWGGERCRCGEYRVMTPRGFERAVGELFRQKGYVVRFTSGSRDGGIDLFLSLGRVKPPVAAVECKQWRRPVGSEVVRSFASALALQDIPQGFVVAHAFTEGAYRTSEELERLQGRRIRLIEVCALCAEVSKQALWQRWGIRQTALVLFGGWLLMVVALVALRLG